MKTTTDVLIAGAGPVGLLVADGVDVLLIDRLTARTTTLQERIRSRQC